MTRLEFEEVLNAFKISTLEKDKFSWYTINIAYPDNRYAIVNGIIPEEVKNVIYERNQNHEYGIMPNGSYAIKNPENFLISYYKFELKEGLILFLSKIYNYFVKTNGLKQISDKQNQEILKKVESAIIQKTNPFQATKEWMKYTECYEQYQQILKDSKCQEVLRNLLNEFDNFINPFMNQEILLKDANLFLDDVHIQGNKTEEEAKIVLWDKDTGEAMHISRTTKGFSYAITYKEKNNENVSFIHYYHPRDSIEYSNTENVMIVKGNINFHYDITTNTIIDIRKNEKRKMTREGEDFLYQELQKAILIAQKIVKKMTDTSIRKLDLN